MHSAPAESPALTIDISGDGDRLALHGALGVRTLAQARGSFKHRRKLGAIDLADLSELDMPGALLLCELRNKGAQLIGVHAEHEALLDLICNLKLKPMPKPETPPAWRELIIQLGKGADAARHDTHDIVTFVGRAASAIGSVLIHPRDLRLAAVSRHVSETGLNALPIIGLMAMMISVVIGYQGVAQLRSYGGEDFTINLVAVSVLREMGVLVTAIMVAGRSGSAFTAEIGVMQAREEVDALEVMGIDPMAVLVVPRLIALIITLPLLTFFSDVMGLVGGGVISMALLAVSPLQYLERVRLAADGSDLFVGLFKAPIFAFIIGVIGCMHGLAVKGSAEHVGQQTTRAVVKSIFLVIVLDALFSILFEKLGL